MREEFELELENRIKNLIWTVSGDYTLDVKPDIESYHRSHAVGLYDGIKQGAFARYFNREELSLYLMKKIYLQGEEGPLMSLAQLCIEWSVAERITKEREGIKEIRKKALEDILEMDFSRLAASEPGRLKLMLFKECLNGSEPATNRMRAFMEQVQALSDAKETIELIHTIDKLYNAMVDPNFEKRYGNLETVLAVSLEELAEFSWKDYLEEEALEESFGTYLEHLNEAMTNLDKMELDQETKKEEPEVKKNYEMMDIISPMFGMHEEKKETVRIVKKNSVKKPKKKDNSLVQVISPYYGNFEEKEETDSEAVLTAVEDSKDFQDETNTDAEKTIEPEIVEEEKLPTVEDNLRNIAKIVEEEQDQLKIIEERTGEFKLDFGQKKSEEQNSLIDEIDDNMSLDELMSLYEKKFKD